MVVGATTSGVFLVAYVLAMEMVGPKFRLMTFMLYNVYILYKVSEVDWLDC